MNISLEVTSINNYESLSWLYGHTLFRCYKKEEDVQAGVRLCLLRPSPKLGAEVLRFPEPFNAIKALLNPLPNMTPLCDLPVVETVCPAPIEVTWLITRSRWFLGIVPNWSIFRRAFGGGVWKIEKF